MISTFKSKTGSKLYIRNFVPKGVFDVPLDATTVVVDKEATATVVAAISIGNVVPSGMDLEWLATGEIRTVGHESSQNALISITHLEVRETLAAFYECMYHL